MIPRFATPVFRPVRATLFVTLGCFGLYSFVTIISHHWSSLFSSQQPPWWCFSPKGLLPMAHFSIAWGWKAALREVTICLFFIIRIRKDFLIWYGCWWPLIMTKASIVPICLYQLKSFPATNRIHGIWWGKLHLRSFSLWNQVFCHWQSNPQAGTKTL